MVSLGIVGFGELASSVYAPALSSLVKNVRLAGVVEPDGGRRQQIGQALPKVSSFSHLEEMLASTELDGVLIATPPTTHADLADQAFEAGLAVYLEKPLAADAADGQRILDAWRRSGAVGMTGFSYRFNTMIRDLAVALQRGSIGEVLAVRTTFGLVAGQLPGWKQQRATGGGALLDLGSHHIDLLMYLLGSAVGSVSCQLWSDRTEDDHAALQLTFENGVVAQIQLSLGTMLEDRIEVRGRQGTLLYDRYGSERLQHTDCRSGSIRGQLLTNRIKSLVPGRDLLEKLRSPWHEPAFPRALAAFVEAVASGRKRSPDVEDGWRALQVILAAEEAHRTRTVQEIPR